MRKYFCGYCGVEWDSYHRESWIKDERCLTCKNFLDNPPFLKSKSGKVIE